MKAAEKLCRQIMKDVLKRTPDGIFTSWLDFMELRDNKIIPEGASYDQVMRAVAFGCFWGARAFFHWCGGD